ncbi:hypothetical protein JW796_01115 [Candidatus Dojkabacteria bacterium]|nr:hypothetical protein [Candidatus Dojkabacteria bacterium]
MKQPIIVLKVILTFLLSAVSITYFADQLRQDKTNAQEVLQSVVVSVNVRVGKISFTVYPEKRIPPTGNWSTRMSVQIRQAGTTVPIIQRDNVTTDSNGYGEIILSDSEILNPGVYDFSFKGISHLRKNYYSYTISSLEPYLNFTTNREYLLAGETSVIVDNYVNSLDVSTVVKNFYKTNIQNDLNRDGQVNSLDLSNQIINLYKFGDT